MDEEGLDRDLQLLYFGGYWLSSDDDILGNFLKPGDKLDLCLMKADEEKLVNDTFEDTFIIHGPKQNFSINMIDSRKNSKIKMKSKHLGIVYRKDGTDPGTRVYHVEIFEVIHSDHVVVKNSGKEKPEVFIGGKKLNPTDATTYDERQNTGLSTNISLWIKKFMEKISFMVFKGRRHRFCFICVLACLLVTLFFLPF